ncbi:MAG TPA: polysaccharide biosynthesis/export family protein [Terriglobales bacterium]|nr:polysaccharide biosynthesis/export family protein [Terriglobales bacterium]
MTCRADYSPKRAGKFVVMVLLLCGITLAQTQPAAPAAPEESKTPKLVIGRGDLIEVSVFGASDFDKQVRVNDEGEIALPFISTLTVAGLTTTQAEDQIAQRLSAGGFFNNPRVSVFVKDYATQGISVLGEVQKPGIYPMLGSRTLLDAVSVAGGMTPKAGRTVTITHRNHLDSPETVNLSGSGAEEARNNVQLEPGDIVVVSKAGIVYVVGAVRQPTGIVLENPSLTVLQAIAMAQGTEPTASLNHAKLIRRSSNQPTEIPLPLKRILDGKSPDVKVQADDIIFVPGSAAKAAGRRGLDAILQAATGVSMMARF